MIFACQGCGSDLDLDDPQCQACGEWPDPAMFWEPDYDDDHREVPDGV